ncbi:MAG: hypothetical protein ACTSU9_05770, partial [Promethearchaeota archaeon]
MSSVAFKFTFADWEDTFPTKHQSSQHDKNKYSNDLLILHEETLQDTFHAYCDGFRRKYGFWNLVFGCA